MKKRKTLTLLPQSLRILQGFQRELRAKKQTFVVNPPLKEDLLLHDVVQGPYFTEIPPPIREYILQHDWKKRYRVQHVFSLQGSPISFTLYVCTDQTQDPSPGILAAFAFLLDRVSKNTVLKPSYELYFYATPFLKQFPEKPGELIDEIHANSGFTVKTSPVPIYVFREEESQRVCLHEMLHALELDGKDPVIGHACLDLLRPIRGQHLCDGNDGVRIYEALTETQATILNTLMQKPPGSFQTLLNKEREHVHCQIQEIERHYGIPDAGTDYTRYKQGISKTISYFLLRGFLMDNLDQFIQKILLLPSSEDYVEIIRKGIQHRLNRGNPSRKKRGPANRGRRTLKMNFSV